MPLFGSQNVDKLAAKHDVKGLVKAFVGGDAGVRQAAARALEQLDDPSPAVPLLVDHLKRVADKVLAGKADKAVFDEGAGVLRAIGAPAVPPLVGALQNSAGHDVVYATLLGMLGEPLGLQPLLEASRDVISSSLRGSAVAGLGTIGTPAATDRLIEIFQDDPILDVRASAGVALAGHKLTGAYETFMASLESEDPASRALAAAGLGMLQDSRAVEHLQQVAANDPDPRVRDSPKSALGQLTVNARSDG